MTDEDFSSAPVSLAEKRAENEGNGAMWTPRDMLIAVLREIDSGKMTPTGMVIAYREHDASGFFNACEDLAQAVGVLELAKLKCFRSSDEGQ